MLGLCSKLGLQGLTVEDRPALIVIDCQNYMVGTRGRDDDRYPSRCGPAGWAAVDRIKVLLSGARAAAAPIFYTRFVLDRDGSDIGVYGLKRDLLHSEFWCLEGTAGSEAIKEREDYLRARQGQVTIPRSELRAQLEAILGTRS